MLSTCFPSALNPFARPPICISPCTDQLSLATSTPLLYLYSYSNQTLSFITKFIPHPKSLSCLAFHPTIPGLLATGGAPNSRVTLWTIEGKIVEKKSTFTLQRRPNALIWLTNEDLIIGDEHGNVYRWNEKEPKVMKFTNSTLSDKQNDEVQLFSMANKQKFILAIGFKSGLICVCHVDLEGNKLNLLHKLSPDSSNTICCSIQFAHAESPLDRSTLFYISYAHGCIKVCDYISGKTLGQVVLVKPSKNTNLTDLRCKTYYPLAWIDSNTLLTGNLEGHLMKIDVRHSSHLEKSQLNVTPPVSGGKPTFSVVTKDDKTLFTYSFNRKLCVYDLATLTLTNSLVSIPGPVNAIQASPLQTSCIAIGVDTSNIGILDLSMQGSPSLTFLWQSIPADVCHLAWHRVREGRIAYSTRLGHVGLYDTLTGRSRVVYDRRYNQTGPSTNVLWGPLVADGIEDPSLCILYSVGDGKFHRWDSAEKNCIPVDLTSIANEASDSSISAVAFSDDWKYAAVACSDNFLRIRSCPTLALEHCLPIECCPTLLQYHPRYLLTSVEASPKQYWVAVNCRDHIRLIDTQNSSSPILRDLVGHSGDVECLAWCPWHDYLLASGGQDRTIRLWNVESGLPLFVYMGHSDVILSLMFSSNQSGWVLTGSRDQSLHIWNIEQHTQSPYLPIVNNIPVEEEETSSNSESKKRHHKPRPNRVEREKKRAAKSEEVNGDQNERLISSANSTMNELNSLAYQLLWPSKTDRETISDLSSLPDRSTLIERIKQQRESSNELIHHLLYWSGEHAQLLNELNTEKITSPDRLFFWMAIFNPTTEIQPVFEHTLNWIRTNDEEHTLSLLTMMAKAKRYDEIVDYLTTRDHIESALLLSILLERIDQIRNRLSTSASASAEV